MGQVRDVTVLQNVMRTMRILHRVETANEVEVYSRSCANSCKMLLSTVRVAGEKSQIKYEMFLHPSYHYTCMCMLHLMVHKSSP